MYFKRVHTQPRAWKLSLQDIPRPWRGSFFAKSQDTFRESSDTPARSGGASILIQDQNNPVLFQDIPSRYEFRLYRIHPHAPFPFCNLHMYIYTHTCQKILVEAGCRLRIDSFIPRAKLLFGDHTDYIQDLNSAFHSSRIDITSAARGKYV